MADPISDPAEALVGPLAALEARVAAADAGGDPVPDEARLMLSKLRELTTALGEFNASIAAERAREAPPGTA